MSNLPEGMPRWASKVPRAKIQRLYETDAQGIVDPEMIDSVGWALWERCDSILTVTAAHHGHVQCPSCKTTIECLDHSSQDNSSKDELIACAVCGWQILWSEYHQTFRGKQLFGANAVEVFRAYHEAFPQARAANAKMLLIDQLIHGFHLGLTDVGRPAAANLIEGSLKEVMQFLDRLSNGGTSATGIGDSRPEWRSTMAAASWAQHLVEQDLPGKTRQDSTR